MLIYTFHGTEIIGVLLTAIIFMLVGMLWYSPTLFGKRWMELVGMNAENAASSKKKAQTGYALSGLSALIMAYVLALFIKNMFVPSIIHAIIIALFLWIGFIATSMSGEYIYNAKPKPWALYRINAFYYLTNLILGSAIIFIFLK